MHLQLQVDKFSFISVVEAMNGGTGLFGPVGIERVSPGMVIDVASLILQGFHAVPVKLKMLLDRLFSLLSPEDITAVLRGFGWTIQDYQRGYILKVRLRFEIENTYLMLSNTFRILRVVTWRSGECVHLKMNH